MGTFILTFNLIIMIVFTICFGYRGIYVLVSFFSKQKSFTASRDHRYFIVVSGRNEEAVIGNLVDSIMAQEYPRELLDLYVVADNCTDDTAKVAREHGAHVLERFDTVKVGKSWALDYAIKEILLAHPEKNYEGMFVFDADNVVDPHFVSEMNRVFDNGHRIVTSYRNSKNYDSSWISAASSLWFFMESRFLSKPRSILKGGSCLISGTGFLISADILRRDGGWTHHLLTEDIEFSIDSILAGERIGFAPNAVLYDEQPITLEQSWNQRMRWSRGFYQVLLAYGGRMVRSLRRTGLAGYDAFMTVAPAMILSIVAVIVNVVCLVIGMFDLTVTDEVTRACIGSLVMTVINFYCMFFVLGMMTTITEWDRIHASSAVKIRSLFTFPLFMFTYFPIAVIAMVKKVEWKPIAHTVVRTVDEVSADANVQA